MRAYIALGSNIEPRENYLLKALEMLRQEKKIRIVQVSSIYETAPVGYTKQGDFLNMVAEIETGLSPEQLLDFCLNVEKQLGRKRTIRFGPRTIDLDLLLYGDVVMESERLTIPHPRMAERGFVLIPLAEIAPDLDIPLFGPLSGLVRKLSAEQKKVKRWEPTR
jgi:2-amino-4-hydroxy-6-hydroxymethyldihydropteridine pyrophosphokinase